jgi:hypothetical protein
MRLRASAVARVGTVPRVQGLAAKFNGAFISLLDGDAHAL